DRDFLAEALVVALGEEDLAHAAGTERADQPIRADALVRQPARSFGHRRFVERRRGFVVRVTDHGTPIPPVAGRFYDRPAEWVRSGPRAAPTRRVRWHTAVQHHPGTAP